MAKIFISYAGEDKAIAEPLAFSLRAHGHSVFLDQDDLPPGKNYDEQIRKAISSCDAFIFLISQNSVAPGRYTLSELEFARKKWRFPHKRVFPVIASQVELSLIPVFLRSVTILTPKGNLTAETVDVIETEHGRPDPLIASLSLAALAAIGAVLWAYLQDVVVFPNAQMDFLLRRGALHGCIVGTIISLAVFRWEGRSISRTSLVWLCVFLLSIIDAYFDANLIGLLARPIVDVLEVARNANLNANTIGVIEMIGWGLIEAIDIGLATAGLLLGLAVAVYRFRSIEVWALVLLISVGSGVALHMITKVYAIPPLIAFAIHWALTGGSIGYCFSLNR